MAKIASIRIHPAIGIARLGNSPDEFFVGPEIPGVHEPPLHGYRDAEGRIKRQAARFRLFAYDKNGKVLQEITADDAVITWSVNLANTKAAWLRFQGRKSITKKIFRNQAVTDRDSLKITPGSRSLRGCNQAASFDTGTFLGSPVPLGDIRTDRDGRLLVLGGFGRSGSPHNVPIDENEFANNDGWHDDVSDGPVTASVTLKNGGATIEAASAWVICALPKFTPPLYNVITLYDVLRQVAVDKLGLKRPAKPSFTHDIYPLLERAMAMRWVSALAAHPTHAHDPKPDHGEEDHHDNDHSGDHDNDHSGHRDNDHAHGGAEPMHAGDRGTEPLHDDDDHIHDHDADHGAGEVPAHATFLGVIPPPGSAAARAAIFERLRDPAFSGNKESGESDMPMIHSDDYPAASNQPLTRLQYEMMKKWKKGQFVDDWAGPPVPSTVITPDGLDRAALESCVGGAFYPGLEAGWMMRDSFKYSAPFRLDARKLEPGDVTKQLALPWQADFTDCVQEGELGWWPAQRPDAVFPEDGGPQVPWTRNLVASKGDMVRNWHRLGFIVRKGESFVETERWP